MLQGWIQIALTLTIVVLLTPLLGGYIARIFLGERTFLDRPLKPLEGAIYRLSGIRTQPTMTGWQYIRAVLVSNLVMAVFAFAVFMLQGVLPLKPTGLGAPTWDTTLHTAISFITNTNQQHYSGETTFSYFSQVAVLGFLFFTSAATGIAVAIAFIRGLTGRGLGNFYVDLTLSITRILLPISLVGAIVLIAAGVPETFSAPIVVTTLEDPTVRQTIAIGPIAHFEIIKELGENGGGFFAINSAHPFENPNGLTNLLQIAAMVAIPSSLIYTYGVFANNRKQAWLLYGMVFGIYLAFISVAAIAEYQGNPAVNRPLAKVT
jgi:K+-transporting ATPase ATPase A chain